MKRFLSSKTVLVISVLLAILSVLIAIWSVVTLNILAPISGNTGIVSNQQTPSEANNLSTQSAWPTAEATPTTVAKASNKTVTTTSTGAVDGYTLIAPITDTKAYLINMDGHAAHTWQLSGNPGYSVYLLKDGSLLATYSIKSKYFTGQGFAGGGIERLDWNGQKLWSYQLSNQTYHLNHDIAYMDNGHILAISYEKLSADKAKNLGFPSSSVDQLGEVWSEAIFEIDPTDNQIIWEWHAKDHLLPSGSSAADNPQLIDPNAISSHHSADWFHLNAIDYNQKLDQIMLSSREQSEVWVIDHHTTTSQAQGPAGDLLWRYGNPSAYGTSGQQTLYGQHNAHWIDPESSTSNILIFNNGDQRTRNYSTVVELKNPLPYQFGKATIVWQYGDGQNDEKFFSDHIGGAQRLSNGDTLICSGTQSHVFEVSPENKIVWDYTNTTYGKNTPQGFNTNIFRAERYERSYSGLLF